MPDISKLIAAALEVRDRAVAPYSKFQVGAALETDDGAIITGANVESASYGLSCCAERVAIFKALTEGYSNFAALAVASAGGAAPCGACRQIIAEYARDAEILLINVNDSRNPVITGIDALFPDSFTGDDLPTG